MFNLDARREETANLDYSSTTPAVSRRKIRSTMCTHCHEIVSDTPTCATCVGRIQAHATTESQDREVALESEKEALEKRVEELVKANEDLKRRLEDAEKVKRNIRMMLD